MEKSTKILLGVAGASLIAYLLWKSSKKTSSALPDEVSLDKCQKRFGQFGVECNDGSCDVSNGVAMPCMGRGGVKGGDTTYIVNQDIVYGYKPNTGGEPNILFRKGDKIIGKIEERYIFNRNTKGIMATPTVKGAYVETPDGKTFIEEAYLV